MCSVGTLSTQSVMSWAQVAPSQCSEPRPLPPLLSSLPTSSTSFCTSTVLYAPVFSQIIKIKGFCNAAKRPSWSQGRKNVLKESWQVAGERRNWSRRQMLQGFCKSPWVCRSNFRSVRCFCTFAQTVKGKMKCIVYQSCGSIWENDSSE